ncbi:MAG: hypothetical protein JXA25_09060 [Anaerolineales bacterium]|nr:hypothetical protein [Anaerolineales bacterium]
MIHIGLGIFLVLHGLVHLLYMGQSIRLFELQPGMVWPDGSVVLSRPIGDEPVRIIASVLLIASAAGFTLGGVGLVFKQDWWRPIILGISIFSSLIFLLFWDGHMQKLNDKGFVGIAINLAILVLLLVFRWP